MLRPASAIEAMTMAFGKHKGKSYEEVASADAGYVRWVMAIEAASGAMLEFQNFLKSRVGGGGGGGEAGSGVAPGPPPAGCAAFGSPPFPTQQQFSGGAAPLHSQLGAHQFGGSQQSSQPGPGSQPSAAAAFGASSQPFGQAGVGASQAFGHAATGASQPFSQSAVGVPQPAAAETLDGKTIFVLELIALDRVELRAERFDPEIGRSVGGTVWLPKPIWNEIMTWPGQQLIAERKCWTFPLANYKDILSRLSQRGWPVDPVPDFALNIVMTKANSSSSFGVPSLAPNPELPSVLMPYQREGVLFGLNQAQGRVLIGDEMGLGKTLQALVLATFFKEDWPVLVVCPSSLRFVWKEQAEKWLPDLCGNERVQVITKGKQDLQRDAAFWVISYNLLADSRTGSKFATRPGGEPHRVVICDESHNIKEWKAQRTKAVVQILQAAKRVMLLSGTPTRNSPDELHPQLCGLQVPGVPRPHVFRKRYCFEKQSRFGGGQKILRVAGARNTHELNLILTSSVMIRRLKKDVLSELPDKRRQRVPIEPANNKLVAEIRSSMANLAESEGLSALFKKLAAAKLPDVKEYVLEVLDRGDEKFIVFAHHHEMLDGIEAAMQKRLTQDGLTYIRIDGSTPAEKRLQLVNKFQEQDNCRVAVLSITACCEGLTMTAAGLVIFAELYWVPGTLEQAEARAHRIGTKHTKVIVEFLVVPGSPDDLIFRQLERKKRDTASVLDNVDQTFEAATQKARTMKRTVQDDEADSAVAGGSPGKRGRGRGRGHGAASTSGASSGAGGLERFNFLKRTRTEAPVDMPVDMPVDAGIAGIAAAVAAAGAAASAAAAAASGAPTEPGKSGGGTLGGGAAGAPVAIGDGFRPSFGRALGGCAASAPVGSFGAALEPGGFVVGDLDDSPNF